MNIDMSTFVTHLNPWVHVGWRVQVPGLDEIFKTLKRTYGTLCPHKTS